MNSIIMLHNNSDNNNNNNNNNNNSNNSDSRLWTAIDQSVIGICVSCAYCLDIALIHKHYKQRWIVASSGIQDARFVLVGTRQLDVPASQRSLSDDYLGG
ncbi:unnamed protein product [Schistosoma mattheei]|uniref:Uncharacterized protein n=1 Tax=Schistosoma mattheei TaxID=31246 RepID=A0A183PJ43_9TREM|nr:unnamed protein product [Schistosoma mattheei]